MPPPLKKAKPPQPKIPHLRKLVRVLQKKLPKTQHRPKVKQLKVRQLKVKQLLPRRVKPPQKEKPRRRPPSKNLLPALTIYLLLLMLNSHELCLLPTLATNID